MGLGLAKDFILFSFLSIIIGVATENYKAGLSVFIIYVIIKIVLKILT